MGQGEMKYEHPDLIRAVDHLMQLGDYNNRIDASGKAGEILLTALDQFTDSIKEETNHAIKKEEEERSTGVDSSMLGLNE